MAGEVTPEEMVTQWATIIRKAGPGAKAAADAMAAYIAWRTAEITLRRSFHPSGAYNLQKGGEPPAYASGTLAKGMYVKPASLGIRATAHVGNKVPYSRILEFGCVISALSKKLHWDDSAGSWYHSILISPPHPFLEATVDEAIDDGELQDAAVEAFEEYDP